MSGVVVAAVGRIAGPSRVDSSIMLRYHVMSCRVIMSCHIMSRHVISCHSTETRGMRVYVSDEKWGGGGVHNSE